mgnify:CR=1 FL=1
MTHPTTWARILAAALEEDPIAAGQIREHIAPERLLELLRLSPIMPMLKQRVEDRLRAFNASTAEWRYVMETLRL